MSTIEQNENKILAAVHKIEERYGQKIVVTTGAIENETGLTPHQINTALSLLDSDGFVEALEGGGDKGHNYSGVLITPKGKRRAEQTMVVIREKIKESKNPREVFVVFGRNCEVHDAMFDFLRSIDLIPKDFDEYLTSMKEGNPYIGSVLDKAFEEAQAILVIITPDDEGRLIEKYRKDDDAIYEKELTPQGRLNVIFEAGMAIGRCPNRTILVEVGKVRPFSDIAGRHMLRFADSAENRIDLADKLVGAGCAVRREGKAWLRAGKFPEKNEQRTPDEKTTIIEKAKSNLEKSFSKSRYQGSFG